MHRHHLLAPAAAMALLAAVAAPAAAGTSVSTHLSEPLTDVGGTITCGALELAPVGGTLDGVMHENLDGRGTYHFTGTEVAHDAVLADISNTSNISDTSDTSDTSGARYRLVGTSSFSGTSTDAEGMDTLSFRTEVSFVVLRPDGGRLGMVRMLERMTSRGDVSWLSGGCFGTGGRD